jgi:hypothetical protein
MLETLLESRSRREGSAGGAIVSVTAHTALIAVAVYATAQAFIPAEVGGVKVRQLVQMPFVFTLSR